MKEGQVASYHYIQPYEPTHAIAPSVRYRDKERRRQRQNIYTETKLPFPNLADEVEEIKQKGDVGIYLLPGTGFHVRTQVDLLLENYKNGVPLSDSLQQLEQDIQGFKIEYLTELPVFPIVLEKKNYNGKMRLVGKLYGGKPFADAISEEEREGVVKSSAQKIEETLLDASPGALIVMTSPKGWSGYQVKDKKLEKLNMKDVMLGNAEEVRYPDSQTYCYQVQKDGSIRGFTLKTDMSLSQNETLLEYLGIPTDTFRSMADEKTAIKQIVGSVSITTPKENKSIEDIAKNIMQIKGSNIAYKDSNGRGRTFTEMLDLLKHPESLWRLEEKVKEVIDPLLSYVSQRITFKDNDIRTDLETALGLTILKLMDKVRPRKQVALQKSSSHIPTRINERISFNPHERLQELQKIGGCAGGGSKNKSIIDSITPRIGNSFDINQQEWFTCPKCSYKADGPVGDTCPGCNLTKEQYAAEEGAVICD